MRKADKNMAPIDRYSTKGETMAAKGWASKPVATPASIKAVAWRAKN
jgi:hypothetical protein